MKIKGDFQGKIGAVGGVSAVAQFFSIRPQSISGWLARGVIPPKRYQVLTILFPTIFTSSNSLSANLGILEALGLHLDQVRAWAKYIGQEKLRSDDEFRVIREFFPAVLEREPT